MTNNTALSGCEVDYTGINIDSIKKPTCLVGRKKLIGTTFEYPIKDFVDKIDSIVDGELTEEQQNEELYQIMDEVLDEANYVLEASHELKSELIKSGEYFIKDDGKIKGINLAVNDCFSLVFQIFINEDGNQISTSRSINLHGFNDAFDQIIELYCKTWGVELIDEIKEKFYKAKKIYRKEYDNL